MPTTVTEPFHIHAGYEPLNPPHHVVTSMDAEQIDPQPYFKKHPWPWMHDGILRELHHEKRLTLKSIAELFGCAPGTVRKYVSRHDIEVRHYRPVDETPPTFSHLLSEDVPYEAWHHLSKVVYVHRLLAVAEYGFAAVKDMHVHHKNGIPWDNRPDNVEVLSPSEHSELHRDPDYAPEAV